MKFSVMISEGPYTHQASDTAYNFTKTALENGHECYRVFFIVNRWSELSKEYDLDLVLCVAAAQRRGIADADEAKRNGKDADNIAEGFRISGLGQLIEAGIQSERLVTFGD